MTAGGAEPVARVQVRAARPDDSAAIALAHVRAWQAAYPSLIPQEHLDGLDVTERTEIWRQRLADPADDAEVLVASVDDLVVGFVGFGPARDEDSGDGGEVYALYVHPDHWGTGAGTALLTTAQAALAGRGYATATLWVIPGNSRARGFYERHGWVADPTERELSLRGVTVPEMRYARALGTETARSARRPQ